MEYLEQARKYVEDRYGADVDDQTGDVLDRWESVLTRLERDPMRVPRELDWVAKLALLERYRERDGLGWDHAKLHLIDLQYADVRPEKGLYQRLVPAGLDRTAAHRGRGRRGRRTTRPRTPAPTSAADAWRSTPSRSRRPRGTR